MVTFSVVIIVLACAAAGVWFYLHSGPDGGRDPGLNAEQTRKARLAKKLEKGYQKDLERQREHPPTHDEK